MPYNILYITPWFPNAPEEVSGNFIYRSCEALAKAGISMVTLVVRPWTPKLLGLLRRDWIRPRLQKEKFGSEFHLYESRYLSIPRYFLKQVTHFCYRHTTDRVIASLIKKFNIQLIHAHTELEAGHLNKKFNLPVVMTLHGIETARRSLSTRARRKSLKKNLMGVNRVILVGEPLRPHFSEIAGSDNHFCIIHNGFFLPEGLNRAKEKSGPEIRIISVSNLAEGKGVDFSIQALDLVQKAGFKNWTYHIVGEGNERKKLEAMVKTYGLGDKVVFYGHQNHVQAINHLKKADVFLLPSYRESFGIANLEAMALGLLSIGVRGQGPEGFIKHGATGFLVPPRDVQSIAGLLTDILRRKIDWPAIAMAGCEHVRKNFTWDIHAQKLKALYGELLERNSGREHQIQ
jgi:glycosyltransferase involved in cell wall biosynthesis